MRTSKDTTSTIKKNGQHKELFGQTFKLVRNGLDENEIRSFVDSLLGQNASLLAKLEHLDSLKKLAEMTVVEAQKEAESIRDEIEGNANTKAAAILAEAAEAAEKQGKERIEDAKRYADVINTGAEVIRAAAVEEANRIKAEAAQNAEELLREIRSSSKKETQEALKIKKEQFKKHYKQIYKELLANLDSITETTIPSNNSASSLAQGKRPSQPNRLSAAKEQFKKHYKQIYNEKSISAKKLLANLDTITEKTILSADKTASRLSQYSLSESRLLGEWSYIFCLFVWLATELVFLRFRQEMNRLNSHLPRFRLTH
jgi:vacuolar-type H+-ATPase subunit H